MKIHISEIRKSPINPKKDFTKNQMESLRESIRRYGFSASLVVCPDFEKKTKYIVIDGNSRFSLLEEFQIENVEVIVNENIKSKSDLIDFISIFDNIKKKYDFSMLNDLQKEMSDFSKSLLHLETKNKKYKAEVISTATTMYILTLPADTVIFFKKRFSSIAIADKFIKDYVHKMKDENFLEIILENFKKNNTKKAIKKVEK